MGETPEIDTRDAGQQRRQNVASAGLEPGTWNDLEQWREETGIGSRSNAVRKLIRDGLDAQTPDGIKQRVITAASLTAVMLLPVYLYATGGWAQVAAVVALTAAYIAFQPQADAVAAQIKASLPI